MSKSKKRWLITGVSGGFGRVIAEAAIARGDSVAGTLRNVSQGAEFEALAPGRAFAILLDVTDRARTVPAVTEAESKLGGIDILVNNAGFGAAGSVEETDEELTREVFETNFFGALRLTRACLPALRISRGHIVNVSSLAGQVAIPGFSSYCASKFALEAMSESLAGEVAPFGVSVTIMEPGAFRTNFSGSVLRLPTKPMTIYDDTPAGQARAGPASLTGREPGDPRKAAAALLKALDSPKPPLHLPLGNDSVDRIRATLSRLAADVDEWEPLSRSTDFDAAEVTDFAERSS